MTDYYYQLANYILNHYDKTSHNDKLALAKQLTDIYNSGIDTAIRLTSDSCGDKETIETLVCGLESSKI